MTNLNEQLFEAVKENKIDEVLELIERGADIGAKNEWGWTLLNWACYRGNTELALKLIEKGAGIEARDKWGRTPLHIACYHGNNTELALKLIEKGADIEAKCNVGQTPLDYACSEGKTETGLMLIEKGADVRARDNDGRTPLHDACRWNNTEIAIALIEKGADTEARDEGGETPLDWASERLKGVLKYKKQNSKDMKENKTFETVIHDLLANNYRIEIEKCLTIAHLIKITVLGEKIECFLYNLNTNFDNQEKNCKAVITRLCKKM